MDHDDSVVSPEPAGVQSKGNGVRASATDEQSGSNPRKLRSSAWSPVVCPSSASGSPVGPESQWLWIVHKISLLSVESALEYSRRGKRRSALPAGNRPRDTPTDGPTMRPASETDLRGASATRVMPLQTPSPSDIAVSLAMPGTSCHQTPDVSATGDTPPGRSSPPGSHAISSCRSSSTAAASTASPVRDTAASDWPLR